MHDCSHLQLYAYITVPRHYCFHIHNNNNSGHNLTVAAIFLISNVYVELRNISEEILPAIAAHYLNNHISFRQQ